MLVSLVAILILQAICGSAVGGPETSNLVAKWSLANDREQLERWSKLFQSLFRPASMDYQHGACSRDLTEMYEIEQSESFQQLIQHTQCWREFPALLKNRDINLRLVSEPIGLVRLSTAGFAQNLLRSFEGSANGCYEADILRA